MRRLAVTGALAFAATLARPSLAHAAPDSEVVDALDEALAELDTDALRGKTVVLAEVASNDLLTLHETHPAQLREALAYALARHGLHSEPVAPVRDLAAAGNAAAGHADGVLAFQLHSELGAPRVQLDLISPAGNAEIQLEPPNGGLISWSWWRLGLIAGLLLAPAVVRRIRAGRDASVRSDAPAPAPRYARAATPAPAPARGEPIIAAPPPSKPRVEEIALSDGALALMSEQGGGLADTHALAGSASVPPRPAEVLRIANRYRVLAELGRGAMGVVYRAKDENLEREVAIKALGDAVRDHPDALRLFASEAKALAALNHANIVAIYDQIADAKDAFLVMELVEGTTLDHELQARRMYPWREALALIDKLCAGLAYAHGKNVVHRDIKPANIFVTRAGDVKLGDFGLARVMREVSIRKTEIRGTPLYMSPEQINGTDIDARSDLYAVGCTLYELLAGRPPFVEGEVMFMHLHADPSPVTDYAKDVPAAVAELVAQLLAKAAADRPASAGAVREAIQRLLAPA